MEQWAKACNRMVHAASEGGRDNRSTISPFNFAPASAAKTFTFQNRASSHGPTSGVGNQLVHTLDFKFVFDAPR